MKAGNRIYVAKKVNIFCCQYFNNYKMVIKIKQNNK